MSPLDRVARRQHLKKAVAPAAAPHQYLLDVHAPRKPAHRDALLDRLRIRWTGALHRLRRHANPARCGDPEWQDPVKRRPMCTTGRFARLDRAGAAEAALRSAVQRAESAVQGDEACYSVSEMHDAALDLAQAARALLNELETRHTR